MFSKIISPKVNKDTKVTKDTKDIKDTKMETNMKKTSNNAIPSIIGSDVTIVGNVSSQGVMQLEGKIEGDININHLTVGNDGWVEGSIVADEAIIKGKIVGTIKARKVVLEKSAKVHGDIQHEIISIEEGAIIEGSFNSTKKSVAEVSKLNVK